MPAREPDRAADDRQWTRDGRLEVSNACDLVGEFRRRLIALPGIAFHRLEAHRFEVGRREGIATARLGGIPGEDGGKQRFERLLCERWVERQQFVEDDAERVNVGAL